MQEPKIVTVVFTGGPCGGKSRFRKVAKGEAIHLGWDVYAPEEPATTLFEEGMQLKQALANNNTGKIMEYEREVARLSLECQARAERFAKLEGRNSVILLDRAIPDNYAYFPAGEIGNLMYNLMICSLNFAHPAEVLGTYSAIIKMTTTAEGAEQFFTHANNSSRTEDIKEARELDKRIEEIYSKHPHLYVIDNSTGWDGKSARAMRAFHEILARA
jgi:thymidylate kinase